MTPEAPRWLALVPETRRVYLDVREDIRGGGEPFKRIMATVEDLADDAILLLRAPFEPVPLYAVLGKRGLRHWTERHAAGDWSVTFYREAIEVLDVRGLEPPLPMVRVLEAVERLAPGTVLEVRHERRPTFLYPQLEERGCVHETDEPEPGLVRIRIRMRQA